MLSGFANAAVKPEGSAVTFDTAQETYTARYTMETVALAFAITEEAIEDNLYDRLASRYTKALARSMANTKQVKAVDPLINGFSEISAANLLEPSNVCRKTSASVYPDMIFTVSAKLSPF